MSGILANSSRLSQLATYIRSNILQETRLVAAKQVMTFFWRTLPFQAHIIANESNVAASQYITE